MNFGKNVPRNMAATEQLGAGGAPPASEKKPEVKPNGAVDGWEERKTPELFRFETPGAFVEGLLTDAGLVEIAEKDKDGNLTGKRSRTMQYIIQGKDGTVKIHGTWDINQKLSMKDVRSLVRIIYKGENRAHKRADNYLREFDVFVKAAPAKFADGTEITDADIPF